MAVFANFFSKKNQFFPILVPFFGPKIGVKKMDIFWSDFRISFLKCALEKILTPILGVRKRPHFWGQVFRKSFKNSEKLVQILAVPLIRFCGHFWGSFWSRFGIVFGRNFGGFLPPFWKLFSVGKLWSLIDNDFDVDAPKCLYTINFM